MPGARPGLIPAGHRLTGSVTSTWVRPCVMPHRPHEEGPASTSLLEKKRPRVREDTRSPEHTAPRKGRARIPTQVCLTQQTTQATTLLGARKGTGGLKSHSASSADLPDQLPQRRGDLRLSEHGGSTGDREDWFGLTQSTGPTLPHPTRQHPASSLWAGPAGVLGTDL